jgi:hypothetical protein
LRSLVSASLEVFSEVFHHALILLMNVLGMALAWANSAWTTSEGGTTSLSPSASLIEVSEDATDCLLDERVEAIEAGILLIPVILVGLRVRVRAKALAELRERRRKYWTSVVRTDIARNLRMLEEIERRCRSTSVIGRCLDVKARRQDIMSASCPSPAVPHRSSEDDIRRTRMQVSHE